MIHYGNVLVQRDGRVWLMPQHDKLGGVRRAGSGWKSECSSGDWVSPIHRTRRDAIVDLIDHCNYTESESTDGSER